MKQLFKNLISYKISQKIDLNTLEEKLKAQEFHPCLSQELNTIGWSHFLNKEPYVLVNNHLFINVRSQKKLLPSSVVNEYLKIKADAIAEEQGFKVGRKQLKEIKEDLIIELLPKAFTVTKDDIVWFDFNNNRFHVNSTSVSKVDEIIGLIAKTFEEFPLTPIHTNKSPSAAMTNWLINEDADLPSPLNTEEGCEVKGVGENVPVIKYKSYDVFSEDIKEHIKEGKVCTQLNLSWEDKVSFVLNEDLHLKQIKYLEKVEVENEEDLSASLLIEADSLSEILNVLIEQGLGGYKSND